MQDYRIMFLKVESGRQANLRREAEDFYQS
jgi:hypothetical protein